MPVPSALGGVEPMLRRSFGRRTIAATVAVSILVGCAAPQSSGPLNGDASSDKGTLFPSAQAQSVEMSAADQGKNPCDEATRREQAFGNAIVGALVGAGAGAFVGSAVDIFFGNKNQNAMKAGTLAGLAIGMKLGYDKGMDSARRQCDVFKAAQAQQAQVAFATLQLNKEVAGEIVATVDDGHFYANTARLTAKGMTYYRTLAGQYTTGTQLRSYEQTVRSASSRQKELGGLKDYAATTADAERVKSEWNRLRIVLTGHTDDHIDALQAQPLSENRALAVAQLFREAGVPEQALMYQGAGSAFPVADNATPVGRLQNNRVEIVVLYGEENVAPYQEARQSDFRLFSPIAEKPASRPATASVATKPAAGTSTAAATIRPAPTVGYKAPPIQRNPGTSRPAVEPATQRSGATAVPAPTVATRVDTPPTVPGIEFDGVPINSVQSTIVAKLGPLRQSGVSLAGLFGIGTAYANTVPIASCHLDDPNRYKAGEIKRLATNAPAVSKSRAPISAGDAYLGIVRRSFSGPAGQHFVEVRGVTPRASGDLVEPISFHVYEQYVGKTDLAKKAAQPDYSVNPDAIAIRGEGGILVRQFFPRDKGLQCMDFLIPNRLGNRHVDDAAIVYTTGGERKVTQIKLD